MVQRGPELEGEISIKYILFTAELHQENFIIPKVTSPRSQQIK